MATEGTDDVYCETVVKKRIFTYKWTVGNFSLCSKNIDIRSSSFKFGGQGTQAIWNLELAKADSKDERYLYLCYYSLRYGRKVTADTMVDFTVFAINAEGEEIPFLEGEVSKLTAKKRMKGKVLAVADDKLLSEDDELMFICQLSVPECVHVSEGSLASTVHEKSGQDIEENAAVEEEGETKNDKPNAKPNHSSPFPCDVTLLVDGKAIPVHENILVSESRVFRYMLRRKRNNRKGEGVVLKIDDYSYETIWSLVAFLYTGKVRPKLDRERARELLLAASRYDVRWLKHFCGKTLLSGLSTADACDLLVLSDAHFMKYVKKEVVKFIEKHWQEIHETGEWKMLEEEHSELIAKSFGVEMNAES